MPDPRSLRFLAFGFLVVLGGCGSPPTQPPKPDPLLRGAHGPISFTRLDAARGTASHFARVYAESIYDPSPPPLPRATEAVNRSIRSAAARIPPPRIGRRARASAPRIAPESPTRIRAAVTIEDDRSPPFSVGFTLRLLADGWRVTAISPPG